MKRTISAAVIVFCCLMLFINGCSHKGEETKKPDVFCRVLCLEDNGMYVWTERFGHIYVKHVNMDLDISALDTVVIDFTENDLISAKGEFTDCFGEEQKYAYVLENPQSIRHNTPEEPTFG